MLISYAVVEGLSCRSDRMQAIRCHVSPYTILLVISLLLVMYLTFYVDNIIAVWHIFVSEWGKNSIPAASAAIPTNFA